jgi:hypothetical protein
MSSSLTQKANQTEAVSDDEYVCPYAKSDGESGIFEDAEKIDSIEITITSDDSEQSANSPSAESREDSASPRNSLSDDFRSNTKHTPTSPRRPVGSSDVHAMFADDESTPDGISDHDADSSFGHVENVQIFEEEDSNEPDSVAQHAEPHVAGGDGSDGERSREDLPTRENLREGDPSWTSADVDSDTFELGIFEKALESVPPSETMDGMADGGAETTDAHVHGGLPQDVPTPVVTHPALEPVVAQSECSFAAGQAPVCSRGEYVDKMRTMLEEKGVTPPQDPKGIVELVKEHLGCDTESCIYRSSEFKQYLPDDWHPSVLEEMFKPDGPSDSFKLLSNVNIDGVLGQLAQKYMDFFHIPYQMRDFEKYKTELATIDLADKFQQFKKFGVVLNTDWTTGRGIHWFCLFGEKYEQKIDLEYFNTSGRPPLPEVQVWLGKTAARLEKQFKMPVNIVQVAKVALQDDEHSCGVWCLFYIWARLLGVPYTWFTPKNVNDKFMHWLRQNLFR